MGSSNSTPELFTRFEGLGLICEYNVLYKFELVVAACFPVLMGWDSLSMSLLSMERHYFSCYGFLWHRSGTSIDGIQQSSLCSLHVPRFLLWRVRPPRNEFSREDVAVAGLLDFEYLDDWRSIFSSDAPYAFAVDGLFQPCAMIRFNQCNSWSDGSAGNPQSKKAAVKLMHRFPSHSPEVFLTMRGMSFVCNSSSRWRMPFCVRKPTMILGTPSRKDCTQNFSSLRWYFVSS